ncbi:MAG: HAD-IIIA family hydrolase [Opitutales bacterium]|nr:HAD-IIIA family hydrolase [Opitutales bacterium]
MGSDLKRVLAGIRLMVFDVDGVLTDGKIYFSDQGETMKVFNVKDGLKVWQMSLEGYQFGIITGGTSPIVTKRAEYMGVQHIFLGVLDKKPVFDDLIKKLNLQPHEVAFMGDDLIDLPVLKAVGCAACPNDAISEVKSVCNFISHHNGGCGAVRELCDAVWEAQHPCVG